MRNWAEKIGVDCIGIGWTQRYLRFGYDSYARTDDPLGTTGVVPEAMD